MALQATDLILVNRASLTYKMLGSAILDPINTAQTTATSALNKATANETAISNLTANSFAVPVGGVLYTASQTVPNGFLPCDGALYSRITYPDLFTALTYTYGGSGDSFAVPDLRSRFISGYNSSEGRGYGSYQESANKSHLHAITGNTGVNSVSHTHAATTADAGSHRHQYQTYVTDAESQTVGTSGFWQNQQLTDTAAAGEHNHTVSIGDNSVNHTHPLALNTELEGVAHGRPQNLNLYAIIKT